MYNEKQNFDLPFAVDEAQSKSRCRFYGVLFGVLGAGLMWMLIAKGYAPAQQGLILGMYLVVAAISWLPMVLRCVSRLRLEEDGVRIIFLGLTLRRYPLEKIRFLTAMECSGKNATAGRSQILLCARTPEELAVKSGWRRDAGAKAMEEAILRQLNRYATSYYLRELNLTKDILWIDWSPERLRLLRWLYPEARWTDLSLHHLFDKQMND